MASFSGSADVYKEERSGIEFPDTIANFKRGKVTPYEAEPGKRGVAIAYSSEKAEVSVYVRVPNDEKLKTSEDMLNDALRGVKALEAAGQYSNVKIYALKPDKETSNWKSAAFTSSSTNRFIISYISCKVAPGHSVKIRATTGDPKNDLVGSIIKSLQAIADAPPKKP
jgi:hypothetical protein